MRYTIGLDNGGTVIKAAIFNEMGEQIAVCNEKVPLLTPMPGFTERNLEALWIANVTVIRKVIEKSRVEPSKIAALGISGHGKGLYLLDKEKKPLYNGIVSTDSRALSYELEFMNNPTIKDKIRECNHQNILACQPVCLLRWLKDRMPKVYQSIGTVLSVKDYIRYRLTGEIFAERTDISGSNLLNLTTGTYDRELLAMFGIEDIYDALPQVKDSADNCGTITKEVATLTGLSENTIVAGGMFDIDACALSLGIIDEEAVCVIAGTWSINEYISKTPTDEIAMNSYYCIPGYYLIEECSPTSAGNLDWILNQFFAKEIELTGGLNGEFYDWLNTTVGLVKIEENEIVFLPFLFGSNESAGMKAALLNLSASSTKGEIAEAIYEGVIFSHKTHIEKLKKAKKDLTCIRLAGGVTKSDIWCRMFADILNVDVYTVSDCETGCFGASIAAGIAVGLFEDYQEAVKKAVSFDKIYKPNPKNVEVFTKKYMCYKKIVENLKNI